MAVRDRGSGASTATNRQGGFAEAEEFEGEAKMMPGVVTEFRDDAVIDPSAATAAI